MPRFSTTASSRATGSTPSSPGRGPRATRASPAPRGDVFLRLGIRGARLIPWQLKLGDVFRLGQAYIHVAQVRLNDELDANDLSALAALQGSTAGAADDVGADDDAGTDTDDDADSSGENGPTCYICYEAGSPGNPLLNLCKCSGSVKYLHFDCVQRWMQPEGSSVVNTHCPICKVRYSESAQALIIRPPAVLLESWSNHRTLKLRHWISFARHTAASVGRLSEQNDVFIPDHSVSGEHAFIVYNEGHFWLHDRESSNGSFIRLCEPLRLSYGEALMMKMGKSILSIQAKRSRWWRLRRRMQSLLSMGDGGRGQQAARRELGVSTPPAALEAAGGGEEAAREQQVVT